MLLGAAKEVLERRQRFDHEEHLIRKQPSRDFDERRVDREQRTAHTGVSKRQRERSGNAAHLATGILALNDPGAKEKLIERREANRLVKPV